MFDEPERKAEGQLADAIRLMNQFAAMLQSRVEAGQDTDHKLRTYEIWTKGLLASLNELEQSCYAANRYRERVQAVSVSQMSEEELLDYRRYVYFDKNAFIRVFSLMDKLSILLNDMLEMKTERIKPHFSYFTVLRNMREKNAHPGLTWKLNDVKEKNKEAMNRLRKRRNVEVHYMNSEMQDDLVQSHKDYGEEVRLENIASQASDLGQGLELVVDSLSLTFQYACEKLQTRKA
ncbi:Cthe_2314 family HEPN domain-containing protein [Paenibacillus sp. NEAU-GSW1]|uniref:Cthe_2314 family HEPN domain-containing protein n=1 Tax=Paenibacillus sp. NEAU-GSW1 TaxID=2682486 RepID=UPI0020A651C1|nr:Cthe_2314 family HEPN domain-containing protein [Paenibacillus sp. NEAU-GSW1]